MEDRQLLQKHEYKKLDGWAMSYECQRQEMLKAC